MTFEKGTMKKLVVKVGKKDLASIGRDGGELRLLEAHHYHHHMLFVCCIYGRVSPRIRSDEFSYSQVDLTAAIECLRGLYLIGTCPITRH